MEVFQFIYFIYSITFTVFHVVLHRQPQQNVGPVSWCTLIMDNTVVRFESLAFLPVARAMAAKSKVESASFILDGEARLVVSLMLGAQVETQDHR